MQVLQKALWQKVLQTIYQHRLKYWGIYVNQKKIRKLQKAKNRESTGRMLHYVKNKYI